MVLAWTSVPAIGRRAFAPVALAVIACGGCSTARESTTQPTHAVLPAARPPGVIAPVVAALAREVTTRSPGTELGLAVYDFTTHEHADFAGETPHVSASSAKAVWVAAALARVGVDPVRPYAGPIFETSSNDAATEVIKLASPNFLNTFYASAQMRRSAFTQWFGQAAPSSPRLVGDDNYITPNDAISFLVAIREGELLAGPEKSALEEWMTWTPRSGFGGWLGTLLPESARATLQHKAGWLPPPYAERAVNEIGVVQVGGGHAYAVAILARHGSDYAAEQAFVEHASCAVYRVVAARSDLDCQ